MSLFPKITCTVSLIGLICLFLMKFTTLFSSPATKTKKKKTILFSWHALCLNWGSIWFNFFVKLLWFVKKINFEVGVVISLYKFFKLYIGIYQRVAFLCNKCLFYFVRVDQFVIEISVAIIIPLYVEVRHFIHFVIAKETERN